MAENGNSAGQISKNAPYLTEKTTGQLLALGPVYATETALILMPKGVTLGTIGGILKKAKTHADYFPNKAENTLYFGTGEFGEPIITFTFFSKDLGNHRNKCTTIQFQNDHENKEVMAKFVDALHKKMQQEKEEQQKQQGQLSKGAPYLSKETIRRITELGFVSATSDYISVMTPGNGITLGIVTEILGKAKLHRQYAPKHLKGAIYFGAGKDGEEPKITVTFAEDDPKPGAECETIIFQNHSTNKDVIEKFVDALHKKLD